MNNNAYNATNMMLCWKPGTSEVLLVSWPDHAGLSRAFSHTALACYAEIREASFERRQAQVFIEAMHLIVRDRCDPAAVHHALWLLAEYRDACADDMPEPATN